MFDSPKSEAENNAAPAEADVQNVLLHDFDRAFYCERYPDIKTDLVDPLEHFCIFGWKEGRDPCAWFSTRRYLDRNADVADSGMNPFLHYILLGKQEGRRIWPADYNGAFELDVDPASTLVTDDNLRDLIRFPPRACLPPSTPLRAECLNIHWVVPDFGIGSGGHMTIFRLIRWLEIAGHACTIWITNPSHHRTADAAYEDILKHFQTIRAPLAFADDGFAGAEGDAVVATGWQTVARVVNAIGFRQRFYLVQDYEPSFHPVGSHALAAEWTYTQDLACICASPWLATLMRERHGRWVSQFWLAYDKTIYRPVPGFGDRATAADNGAEVPRIALYARLASARRAVEFAFLALEYLAAKGVRFHVDFFGDEIAETVAPFPCSSHGILDASGLAELYRNAHLGICFSATNYSLVPQEMMACGLPVVEIDGESTRAVFPEDVVTLTGRHPCAIADGIEALLRDPDRRHRQAKAALQWVDQFDWEKSAKAIEQALLEKLNPPGYQEARALNGKPTTRSRKSQNGHKQVIDAAPKVSICIPTFNGGKLLTEVVKRVCSQRAPWHFELIVVDSNSTDGSTKRLASAVSNGPGSPDFRLRRIPKADFQHGRTRNLCAGMARGEFVVFLTQDAIPADEFWLYNLTSVLERFPGAAGAFGRHLPYPAASPFTKRDITGHFDGFLRLPLVLSRDSKLPGVANDARSARKILHFFSDNNACLRKSVWEAVPYPEIDYGEDQAWADKIIRLGYEKVYVPSAVVYHSHTWTPTEVAERAAIESFFFATTFGYEMYDQKRTFQDQLAAANNADIHWAQRNAISEDDLTQRLLENKAKLYGRAMGMERAKHAIGSLNDLKANDTIVQHIDHGRPLAPASGEGQVNGAHFADVT